MLVMIMQRSLRVKAASSQRLCIRLFMRDKAKKRFATCCAHGRCRGWSISSKVHVHARMYAHLRKRCVCGLCRGWRIPSEVHTRHSQITHTHGIRDVLVGFLHVRAPQANYCFGTHTSTSCMPTLFPCISHVCDTWGKPFSFDPCHILVHTHASMHTYLCRVSRLYRTRQRLAMGLQSWTDWRVWLEWKWKKRGRSRSWGAIPHTQRTC